MATVKQIPQRIENIIQSGYVFNFNQYLQRGFDIFNRNVGGFVLFTLLAFFIMVIAAILSSMIPFLSTVLSTPLIAGYLVAIKQLDKESNTEFSNFFRGFDYFVHLVIASLIVGIFTFLGFIAIIIPGIYLIIAYSLVNHFIIYEDMDFWTAMEASRRLITKNWFSFFGLTIVILFINILGALLLGIGLLASVPISACVLYAAYDDIIGFNNTIENELRDLEQFDDDNNTPPPPPSDYPRNSYDY